MQEEKEDAQKITDVVKEDLRHRTSVERLPRKGPQLAEIQPLDPVDNPVDEFRESLQSLKSTIRTLGHQTLSGINANRVLHSTGMLCEALLLGKPFSPFLSYSSLWFDHASCTFNPRTASHCAV